MHFLLPLKFPALSTPIGYQDIIYLTGSCFTEHMSRFLAKAKFRIASNAHGILFNPFSVCKSIHDVIEQKRYTADELFCLDEYWHSWYHHSDFSDLNQADVLTRINKTIVQHHDLLKKSNFMILTLGSAFAYQHIEKAIYVNNNHRAPHAWFQKELLSVEAMVYALQRMQQALHTFNPDCKIIFTISPVRHSRDGVIENNRSKARLIEAVHQMKDCYYFPAYEIVIDELRDYRFYDADLVHPNYAATQYVWEKFLTHCIDANCHETIQEMDELSKALHHKPKNASSKAHQQFLRQFYQKTLALKSRFPYLDFEQELAYFIE
ncbi:MAG TPA: GSCFA domain-containing protein [Chitinophagaceae bacterium]|jgi:hypothetical protein|nr:GSCFA domain-containing protein [Bacteroidota bacterium]MBK9481634.1 GSCFA domain-containing protein [Bacteroidota bacterium]HQW46677.1 GSCFA domain-containing protein [Chitinophagaceae bacterium]